MRDICSVYKKSFFSKNIGIAKPQPASIATTGSIYTQLRKSEKKGRGKIKRIMPIQQKDTRFLKEKFFKKGNKIDREKI